MNGPTDINAWKKKPKVIQLTAGLDTIEALEKHGYMSGTQMPLASLYVQLVQEAEVRTVDLINPLIEAINTLHERQEKLHLRIWQLGGTLLVVAAFTIHLLLKGA